MYTAGLEHERRTETVDNERVLSLFGVVLGVVGSGAVLFFWTMGRILRHTGNGGQLNDIGLTGLWSTLFNAYPFFMLACLVVAAFLYWGLGRYKEAAGMASLPIVAAIVYYLALVALR